MRAELENRRDRQFLVAYVSLMLLLPTVYAVALVVPTLARTFVVAFALGLGLVAGVAYRSAHRLDGILRESRPARTATRADAVDEGGA